MSETNEAGQTIESKQSDITIMPVENPTGGNSSKSRGRPVGSISYIETTLKEIRNALGDGDCVKVRVDRRWAAAVGVGKPNQAATVIVPESESIIQINVE